MPTPNSKCGALPCYQCRQACAGEFFGTLALVVAGAGTVAATTLVEVPRGLFLVALGFGLTVGLLGIALGKVSGAHVNPAVSLASVLAGRLRTGLTVPFAFFQLLGALTAGAILRIVFPYHPHPASWAPPYWLHLLHPQSVFFLS